MSEMTGRPMTSDEVRYALREAIYEVYRRPSKMNVYAVISLGDVLAASSVRETLAATNERIRVLEEALKAEFMPFGEVLFAEYGREAPDRGIWSQQAVAECNGVILTLGSFRRAAAALAEKGE